MKTIRSQFDTVEKIGGRQRFSPGRRYRPSCFSLEADCADGRLLYNALTGELLLLEPPESPEDEALRDYLVQRWFLVPQDFDELRHCEQIRSVARLLQRKKGHVTHFVVFTTTDCNARCFYCFEKGQHRLAMTEETARDAAAYMLAHAGGEKISIRWFGGEPLFNAKVIDVISQALRDQGADYESVMFSNAYLFDQETVEKAGNLWNLRQVVVTIDGTEEVYNRTKAYIYRDGSPYRRVLANIDRLLDAGINVLVNLSLDAQNAQNQFELADELGQRFGGRQGFTARAELLIEYVGKIPAFDSSQQALDRLQALNERLASYGVREKKRLYSAMKLNACMSDDPGSAVIMPDGRLGRCEHFGDREEVGSIYGDIDAEKIAVWKELRPTEAACKTCVVYPKCFRLKKCNACPDECNDLFRGRRILDMQDRMRFTYEKWKADGRSQTGGD